MSDSLFLRDFYRSGSLFATIVSAIIIQIECRFQAHPYCLHCIILALLFINACDWRTLLSAEVRSLLCFYQFWDGGASDAQTVLGSPFMKLSVFVFFSTSTLLFLEFMLQNCVIYREHDKQHYDIGFHSLICGWKQSYPAQKERGVIIESDSF